MLGVTRPANRSIVENRAGQGQRATLSFAIEKVRIGNVLLAIQFCVPRFGVSMHRNKPVWLWIWQRPQQNSIDHSEHYGGSSHAERQRQNSHRGKGGTLPQHPHRVPEVLPKILYPARPPRIPALLLHLLRPAERHPRTAPCFRWIHSAGDQFIGMLLQVKTHLFFEHLFHLVAPQQTLRPVHSAPPSDNFRISATASVNRSQLAASASSCVRPFTVNR